MKRLQIDFAPQSVRRGLWQTGPWTWLFCVCGAALMLVAILTANRLHAGIATAGEKTRAAQTKLLAREASLPEPNKTDITEAQANTVNAAISQLNLPWRDILDAIEAATPAHVALLSLDPDAKKHLIRGHAEAKNSDEMIDYIWQLKRQPFLSDVVLLKHETNEQDPHKPLRFQFEAQWQEVAQ